MFELLYLFVIFMLLYLQEKYASTARANDKLEEADLFLKVHLNCTKLTQLLFQYCTVLSCYILW
jgi:hypothetical protein